MATELRKTGISIVGDMPWGTHFCYFYETKQDLLDILIPYFKAGLENSEFCLWIISNSELLTMQEAMSALRASLPDLDRYLAEGSLEVVSHNEWFFNGGTFDLHKVAKRFKEKLDEALTRGYAGMRVNGSPAWLYKKDGKELSEYEEEVDNLFPHERIIASCTYPVGESGADVLLDVARHHRFAIARRHGNWEILETPELVQAKREIKRLNEELERRVIERTKQLAATNEELRKEIAERRRAEDALRKSEKLFTAFMDHLPGYAWIKDVEGRYVYINETFLQFRNAVGKTDAELWPAEIASTYRANDNQVIQTKNALQTIEPFPKDPEQGCQIVSKFPILDQDGAVVMVGGASVDITERIEAEEAVRRSEEHLRLVIDTIPTMAWSLLPDGVVDFLNQPWMDYTGLSLEEYVKDPTGPIHPEDIPRVIEKWLAQKVVGEGYEEEMRLRRADGEYRWFLVRTAPLRDEQGNIVKWYGVSIDIQERKQAEEKLKETTEQLRALSARLQSAREEEGTRIAREIHDELGAALTSLRWDLESFDKTLSDSESGSQLQVMRERITTMMKLIDTTVSAVRRITRELRPSVLDDLGLVEAIEWQAEQFQARTGIICHFDCSLEDVALSQEQSTVVFRIFQEALTNILRHAQATRVDITMEEKDGESVLTINDNGRGITEDQKSGQHSLGLLGMRERAHLIGGKIDITGVEGKGTVVTLRILISG
jgi:PAS domain S-box-containing protein